MEKNDQLYATITVEEDPYGIMILILIGKQKELELLKEKDQLMQRNINQQRGLLFLFALLMALLGYMVYAFYRKKEIVQQNNLLLQQQKQDYSSIFNLITDGIAILDANNRVIDTNKAYHELLHKTGLTSEQNQLPDIVRHRLQPVW